MLAGPLATARRGQRWRSVSRSKRTNNGPPQVHRLATWSAGYVCLQRLHSRRVALGIKEQVYHRAERGSGQGGMDNVIDTTGWPEFTGKVLYLPVTAATMTEVMNVIIWGHGRR